MLHVFEWTSCAEGLTSYVFEYKWCVPIQAMSLFELTSDVFEQTMSVYEEEAYPRSNVSSAF
jgi:hypothetical protein